MVRHCFGDHACKRIAAEASIQSCLYVLSPDFLAFHQVYYHQMHNECMFELTLARVPDLKFRQISNCFGDHACKRIAAEVACEQALSVRMGRGRVGRGRGKRACTHFIVLRVFCVQNLDAKSPLVDSPMTSTIPPSV